MAARFRIDCHDAVLSGRASAAEWRRILALRQHPRFGVALSAYHSLIGNYFADKLILNKVVTEAWRFEMLVYLLYLYDQRDSADPRGGLTVTNMRRICALQKCASPGRVLAILAMMQVGGYLRRKRSVVDNRIVHLEPSTEFVNIVEGWNQRILQVIDTIIPEDELALAHASHPRFGWEMRGRGAEGLLKGWKLLDPFPEVFHFVSRDGGWMLLLHCVAESLRLGEGDIAPVSVDLGRFGARFGVSRSHLRRLLESAYSERLLDAKPSNGACILPAKHLVASFLTCMASELGYYRAHALRTRDALKSPAGPIMGAVARAAEIGARV